MCDAILVTLLKVRPHHSQSSRENATWCSVTPPLASYQEDPSPNPPGEEQRHRLTFLRGIAMWIGSKCKKNGFVKNGHLRCWCDGQSEPNSTFQETRGSFLESPDNWRARKAVLVYMHDRGFNSFASNMIKLSVNEIKWSSLLARTHALILFISIWIYLILPGLSRNGPLVDLANSYSESSGSMVSRLFLIRVATKHRSRSVVSLFWNEVKIKWV